MDEPGFLSSTRVAILGLGLMGGSLALALRGKCASVWGVDPSLKTLALARERNVVDRASTDPAEILPQADLLILAAPVRAIIDLIHRLPELHPGPAVVLDLGSTKNEVLFAMAELPDRFDPVGGHPMCGKEKLTLENADPSIFQGATFAFTPLPRSTSGACRLVEQLAIEIGARPAWLDPEIHDRWAAATSHLPYLLASALVAATPGDAAPLAGPGFRSTSRLAGTSPGMMVDVLITNRQNILTALKDFRESLNSIEDLIASNDFDALNDLLNHCVIQHRELTESAGSGVLS